MQAKWLTGWFVECLDCKARFFYIVRPDLEVEDGRIFRVIAPGVRRKIGSIKCPECLSGRVESLPNL